jgi:hypothetical protein
MSPFGVKMPTFLLKTPFNGKDVPSFAILVFYIIRTPPANLVVFTIK